MSFCSLQFRYPLPGSAGWGKEGGLLSQSGGSDGDALRVIGFGVLTVVTEECGLMRCNYV
jgi:hypothetical protein